MGYSFPFTSVVQQNLDRIAHEHITNSDAEVGRLGYVKTYRATTDRRVYRGVKPKWGVVALATWK
jgi:hypothetical protein